MFKPKFFIYLISAIAMTFSLQSCHDDLDISSITEPYEDPTLPAELKEGLSISFQIALSPLSDEGMTLTRAITNDELREIENFVDMQKVRILFFSCLDDSDRKKDSKNNNKPYETGKHDIFLFESRSRWVSALKETSYAKWQVTAPVFTYGKNDEYDWEYIREALTTRPFKIALLVNRPENVDFGDFDSKFGSDVVFTTDRGPDWGPKQSEAGKQLYALAKNAQFNNINDAQWKAKVNELKNDTTPAAIINDLHHCQWDPIYSSKNSGNYVYDCIMGNPKDEKSTNGNLKKPGTTEVGDWNMMGALSYWTQKKYDSTGKVITDPNNKDKDATFFFLPDKTDHPIPMYGVQKFPKIPTSWKPGTPFNVSEYYEGQEGTEDFNTNKIYLLRSLVRLDLIIPTTIATNVTNVRLKYANVMARTEPLDVATPTDQIWEESPDNCEFKNICAYGPIITGALGTTNSGNSKYATVMNADALRKLYLQRIGWFYGAWKDWWDFTQVTGASGDTQTCWNDSYFTGVESKMPHPRIYNPVIQRNQEGQLADCKINDPGYHHYVVYCGERNINDPTDFQNIYLSKTEFVYFYFEADGKAYGFPITDFSKNNNVFTYSGDIGADTNIMPNYRTDMASSKTQSDWNYPLLRNHVYTFTVTKIGQKEDDGLGVVSVTSEDRTTPTISYY